MVSRRGPAVGPRRQQRKKNTFSINVGSSNRFFVIIIFFLILAAFFLVRLLYLEVVVANEYSERAKDSRIIGIPIEPRRGTIYDRNGHILAMSVEARTIYANPSEVHDPVSVAHALSSVLEQDSNELLTRLSNPSSSTFVYIARKVDIAIADKVKQLEIPGIYFIDDTRREYPYGKIGGQVIGACSIEVDAEANREYYVGICGLEMYYDTILSGTPGYSETEIAANGTAIPGGFTKKKNVVDGQDIIVSIDIEFQEELEEDLKNGVKRVGVKSGSAVVMDAATGEIYAASSAPFFNPGNREKVPEGSMQLKAATNLFEPGSIFKTVSAMSLLEHNKMTPDTITFCPTFIEADGYIVKDAYSRPDQDMSLREILNMSSNVGISLAVEERLGFYEFYKSILKYRFNKLTGIDYPGEQLGYLLDFDKWSQVQGYNATFGQGLSVNPFQMITFYGSLLNDGIAQTPHFLLRKPQTNERPEWSTHEIIDNKESLPAIRSMLETVVSDGTGMGAAIPGYDAAGKTSTAEIYDEENGGYRKDAYNIAFCGFINNSSSDLVCFCSADEVPADRSTTIMFHDIMIHAIDRYNIVPM